MNERKERTNISIVLGYLLMSPFDADFYFHSLFMTLLLFKVYCFSIEASLLTQRMPVTVTVLFKDCP